MRVARLSIVPLLLISAPATAHTLIEQDALVLEAFAWAQAGYVVADPPDGELEGQTYLGMARLGAQVQYRPWGSAFVQIEGISGTIQLLDVVAELTPVEFLAVRAGQFRTPTSADLMIAGPQTPFVNRSILVDGGFVQQRLAGIEIEGKADFGLATGSLRWGVFNPTDTAENLFQDTHGQFLSARALVDLPSGLHFHLAFIGLISGDNNPPVGPRPVPFDKALDTAVYYVHDGWTAYVEGVVDFDGPGAQKPYAAYIMFLKSVGIEGTPFSIEPGARYEFAKPDGDLLHRITLGLNLYLIGDYLNISFNYELLLGGGETGHALYGQIQAGF